MNDKEIKLYEQFIGIYNQIDEYMRKQLRNEDYTEHVTAIDLMAKQDHFFASHGRDLKNLAKLRNVLEHNPYRQVAHPMATPHPVVVAKYAQLRDALIHPPLALALAIPFAKVYTTTLQASAIEVMGVMDKNTFTHVPVMEKNNMIGVFSENVLMSYMVDNKEVIITPETKIEEFKSLLDYKKHHSESFKFVARSTTVAEVFKLFNDAIKVQDRIGMVFITQNGKPTEKLLGILTAWDLANYDELLASK